MILSEMSDSIRQITWYCILVNQDFQVFCGVSAAPSSRDMNPEPTKHKTGVLHATPTEVLTAVAHDSRLLDVMLYHQVSCS